MTVMIIALMGWNVRTNSLKPVPCGPFVNGGCFMKTHKSIEISCSAYFWEDFGITVSIV